MSNKNSSADQPPGMLGYYQMSSLGVERGVGNPSLGGCQSKHSQKNETGSS